MHRNETRMNQGRPTLLSVILLLLVCLGAGAAAIAFWLFDHRQGIPGSGFVIAASFGIFFVSCLAALLLYLRRRDRGRAIETQTVSSTRSRQNLEGSIYEMIPGSEYRVVNSFTDYYGNSFERDEILRFKERHFLPYEGGHTIVFVERSLYLQEEKNREIIEHFSEYMVRIMGR